MPTTLVAVLLAATASAPRPPSMAARSPRPATAPGVVITPEGIRFRLPPGLAYSTEESEGRQVHVAKSADGSTVVLVSAFASDSELPCEAEQEGAEVEAFETSRGLRACSVSAAADDADLAFALVYVKAGEALVAVTAFAPAPRIRGLTTAVANSVVVPAGAEKKLARADVPRADPRLIGCFEREANVTGAVIFWKRCFAEDLTFTQKYGFGMSTTYVDTAGNHLRTAGLTDRREREGVWVYSDGALLLRYEDGTEAELSVEFVGDDLLVGRELWRRL